MVSGNFSSRIAIGWAVVFLGGLTWGPGPIHAQTTPPQAEGNHSNTNTNIIANKDTNTNTNTLDTPTQIMRLGPGDHEQILALGPGLGRRTYLMHVPPQYDPTQAKPLALPVVLVFHGAGTDAAITVRLTGMNAKADQEGFLAVYPNGTGFGRMLTWNAGGWNTPALVGRPDDVAFVRTLLDDVAQRVTIDPKRIFATGMSNGGMMCYRLAQSLPDRIAAIAPVAGTMTTPPTEFRPDSLKRPVPVLHFHGTDDQIVPLEGAPANIERWLYFAPVRATISAWAQANGCPPTPKVDNPSQNVENDTTIRRERYGPGTNGVEVILCLIEGGGHTWPGSPITPSRLGKTTRNIKANDLIWEFFLNHPLR